MVESHIRDGVVVTKIPAGTPLAERERALAWARHLAQGASSKGQKYKTNWAEYHKKKRLANQVMLDI